MTGNANVGVLPVTENLFQLVADVAPVLVWMSGPDKLCTFFNKGWLDFTGRPIERELGNGWADGVHPDDLPTCLDTYSSAFDRRDPFKMEYRLRRRDGEYRWVLDEGVPLFSPDGTFAGYIGSCVDITERRHAEDAVRHKEMELRESQRHAGVGSWRWDAATDTVRWSEEAGIHFWGQSATRTTARSIPQKAGCSCSARSKRRSARAPRMSSISR